MIQSSLPISLNTPLQEAPKVSETFWDKLKDILWKVWDAVKLIFYVLAGVFLYLANPTLFAIGFAVGIIFDEKFKEVSQKIMHIYKESQFKVLALIGVGAFLSLAVTAGTIALAYGAHLGNSLLKNDIRPLT